jgi:hypothetical protein
MTWGWDCERNYKKPTQISLFFCGEIEQLGIVILRDFVHPFLKKYEINHI